MTAAGERLQEVGELALLARIFRRLATPTADVVVGPGDDGAVLAGPGGEAVVFTTDAMAEGVHFDFRYMTPADVGWRLVAANLSDLAALGAAPWAAVISLAAPPETAAAAVEAFYDGAVDIARANGLNLIGGDVVASRAGLFFAMAALGKATGGKVLTRAGASPGDVLILTGEVAAAQAGLDILAGRAAAPAEDAAAAIARYRRPVPRVAFGQALVAGGFAAAAIDTSDSVSESCAHLARASAVGITMDGDALPIAAAARAVAAALGVTPLDYALAAGEDFELLFAVPPAKEEGARAAAAAVGLPATVVGRVTAPDKGILIRTAEGERPLRPRGFAHFGPFSGAGSFNGP